MAVDQSLREELLQLVVAHFVPGIVAMAGIGIGQPLLLLGEEKLPHNNLAEALLYSF